MNKKLSFFKIGADKIIIILLMTLTFLSCSRDNNYMKRQQGRRQWTEKEAWEWEKRVGVIKGFNAPNPAYQGMTREDVIKKASELGYNSVRIWLSGKPDEHVEFLQ